MVDDETRLKISKKCRRGVKLHPSITFIICTNELSDVMEDDSHIFQNSLLFVHLTPSASHEKESHDDPDSTRP